MIMIQDKRDTRIAYGARCTWWGGIESVGSHNGLPCCPHCNGVLFEVDSPDRWWRSVDSYEADGHEGYRGFIEWSKGKCYRNRAEAKKAYEAKEGRKAGF
jgi:hypothetical protein